MSGGFEGGRPPRQHPRRALVVAGLAVVGLFGLASAASAHPLGNATTNQHVGVRISPDHIDLDYVLDLAELTTYQECGPGGCATGSARARCAAAADRLQVAVAGRTLPLTVGPAALTFPPGTAGLATLRLECALSAAVRIDAATTVHVRNSAYPGTVGWREITAAGDRTTLTASDVPAASASVRLTAYPDELLSSPANQREATLAVVPGGPALATTSRPDGPVEAPARGLDRLTLAYTSFVSSKASNVGFLAVAVLVSVGLGGLHALAPGHGKTVMAAYVVGARGTVRQVAAIGLTVAATHTAGVLGLGLVLATFSAAPERIYPWLAAASGLLLLGIGATMLRAALRRSAAHVHDHHHSRRGLVGLGIAGGIVPSPSAVLVLLGGLALGRVWFGLLLVIAYGLGLAAALATIGLLFTRGRSVLERRAARLPRLTRAMPIAASSVVLVAATTVIVGAATKL